MANRTLSDFIGTLRDYILIGLGVRLKNNSSVFEIRNNGDTAFINTGMHSVEIHGSNASNKVTLTAPADLSGNVSFTLMSADGSPGQFIKTDGSNNLSFADSSSNGILAADTDFTQASSSPLSLLTPPANSIIVEIIVKVTSAASGGSPTLSIGVSGTVERDMAASEINLKAVGNYHVSPETEVGETPAAMIATITPDSQSFAGKIIVCYSTPA